MAILTPLQLAHRSGFEPEARQSTWSHYGIWCMAAPRSGASERPDYTSAEFGCQGSKKFFVKDEPQPEPDPYTVSTMDNDQSTTNFGLDFSFLVIRNTRNRIQTHARRRFLAI